MRFPGPITHWLCNGVVVTHVRSALPLVEIDRELKSVHAISGILKSWRHIIIVDRSAAAGISRADSLTLPRLLRRAFGRFSSCHVALVSASEYVLADLHRIASTMRTDRLHIQVFANLPSAFDWIRLAKTLDQHDVLAGLAAPLRSTFEEDRTLIDGFGENQILRSRNRWSG